MAHSFLPTPHRAVRLGLCVALGVWEPKPPSHFRAAVSAFGSGARWTPVLPHPTCQDSLKKVRGGWPALDRGWPRPGPEGLLTCTEECAPGGRHGEASPVFTRDTHASLHHGPGG